MDCLRDFFDMVRGQFYRTGSHQYEQLDEDQPSEQQPTSASESGLWPIYSLPDQMDLEEPSVKQPATNELTSTTALEELQPSYSQNVHVTFPTPSPNDRDLPRSPDNALLPWVPHWFALEDTLLPPEDNPTSTEDPPSPSEQTPPPSEKASLPSEDTLLSSPFSSPLVPSLDHDVYRSIPKPRFPIPFSKEGPRPFSIDERDRKMRTTHRFFWDPILSWRTSLDTELIKETITPVLELLGMDQDSTTISYLEEGGFNTVYTVTAIDRKSGLPVDYVVRIPFPVDPYYKMECDVATTELIRHFTSIPVPTIYAYDSSTANPLGLEWMLMEKIEGKELGDRWLDMDNEDHKRVVHQVAQWMDEMSKLQSDQIGGVYLRWTDSELEFFIGPSVDLRFVRNRRRSYRVNRGPFNSVWDYYDAFLDVQKQEFEDPVYLNARSELEEDDSAEECLDKELDEMTDEEKANFDEINLCEHGPQVNWSKRTVPSLNALQKALPIFREGVDVPDLVTTLVHWDISFNNLFVDSHDRLIALLDWEHNEFAQVLRINPLPDFLRSEDVGDDDINMGCQGDVDLDFWGVLMEKQVEMIQTYLRPIFKGYLEELESPLLDLFDQERDWTSELHDRVVNVAGHDRQIRKWVELHLANAPESESESMEL